ncbi:MAG: leucine-rich repeat domain-containing protein [Muribaculaceae bacterium]|nr:leucine-rich repeat domain-containing protein [Muribaculaceae bacterium]
MRKVILLLLLVFCMAIPDIQAAVKVSIDKLKYEIDTEAHTATVTGLAKYEETYDLVIPDFIDYNNEQIPVTAIGNSAFNLFSNRLKGSLTIGDNVTTIGDFAFGNCSGFTGSLTIGDNVTTIGEHAF